MSNPMSNPMSNQVGHSIMANPPAHVFEEDEMGEPFSTISISIRAPITVTGNNNTLSIDPAVTGSKIAIAVVTGLRQMSGIAGGVPMIDENGRPRPIIVDVDGSTKIEGSGNLVGDRAVFLATKPSEVGDVTKKRERSDSEPMDAEPKRPRTSNV